ncbi:hypothetical protein NP233_g2575 [Leucocoprinus birnbaumii]|uniref:Uncharacterized protein n=1 Tax=Leucocoprinus birnbaumii TaxID=56174 RepID=A0AAD5VY15_9AGAR|nr:hypothetical protein NP233_g2575 [Leucocoprinus birnbaumii]
MASTLRLASALRSASTRIPSHRLLSHSTVLREEANLGTVQAQKKPIGGKASAALQASVEELKLSTEKVSAHVRRIEAVEKDLKALGEASASKDDIARVRAEVKKLYDGLHVEFLDLRAHVWGIQQDLHKLSKKEATEIRI